MENVLLLPLFHTSVLYRDTGEATNAALCQAQLCCLLYFPLAPAQLDEFPQIPRGTQRADRIWLVSFFFWTSPVCPFHFAGLAPEVLLTGVTHKMDKGYKSIT